MLRQYKLFADASFNTLRMSSSPNCQQFRKIIQLEINQYNSLIQPSVILCQRKVGINFVNRVSWHKIDKRTNIPGFLLKLSAGNIGTRENRI